MVICRCGCQFENSSRDSHVMCPECKRIYPNSTQYMYHPKTEEELSWKCSKCETVNDHSYSGCPRSKCANCGASRPGNPEDWYNV